MTILAVAGLLLATDEPRPGPKNAPPPSGWSIASSGSGIPRGQNASEYVAGVDREITHGGQAAMSMRSIVAKPTTFRAVSQFVKADTYRGKRVRLAGYLKTRDVADWSGLWLRVDGPDSMLAFDNMASHPAKGTTDWARYEVVLDVPEAALRLAFGPVLRGEGQVWADDLTLDVVDPKEIKTTQPAESYAKQASNLDFEAAGADAADPVPGWKVRGSGPQSYSQRIAEGGAHGGRAFLEIKSTQQGTPSAFAALQDIAGGAYRGKRVRFRTYLKTEGLTDAAYVSMASISKFANQFASTLDQGSKGTTDWRPHEVVLDVPADAESLRIGVILRGAGTLGVDDASLEVVDPARVRLTPKSEVSRTDPEKRARELAEALAKMPTGRRTSTSSSRIAVESRRYPPVVLPPQEPTDPGRLVRCKPNGPPGSVPGGPDGQTGRLPWICVRISSRTIHRQATSCLRVQSPRYAGSLRGTRPRRGGQDYRVEADRAGRTGRPPRPAAGSRRRSWS